MSVEVEVDYQAELRRSLAALGGTMNSRDDAKIAEARRVFRARRLAAAVARDRDALREEDRQKIIEGLLAS